MSLEFQCEAVQKLANHLKNLTIIKKGKQINNRKIIWIKNNQKWICFICFLFIKGRVDVISNGHQTICNLGEGSLKRCGGIGDLLTGAIGTFTYWCQQAHATESSLFANYSPNIIAAYCASSLIKECSRRAFNKYYRSLLAVDIIEEIPQTFHEMYD